MLTLVVLAALAAGAIGMPREGTAQCSVLDRHPCTPYCCGVHSPPGCMPEIFYSLRQTALLGGAIAGRPFIISIIEDRKDTKDDIHEH